MNLALRMSKLYPEGAYAVLSQAQTLEKQGESIIHLEIGQPDFETPRHISLSGIKAIGAGKTKYTPPLGIVRSSKEIARYLLEKAGIALLAGSDFGRYGEGYLRISYASSMSHLQEGLQRLQVGLAAL